MCQDPAAVVTTIIAVVMEVVVRLAYRKVNHLQYQVYQGQVAVHQFYHMHLEYLPIAKIITNKNDTHHHHHLEGGKIMIHTHQHPRINLYCHHKAVLIHVHPNQLGKVQMTYFIIHML